MESVEITESGLAAYDCVVLVTNHQRFDYQLINQSAKLIVDTRGVFDDKDAHVVFA